MKITSKVLIIFLLFSYAFAENITISAHSGNTDSSGCHNDNINGGRHCHNSKYNLNRTPSLNLRGSDQYTYCGLNTRCFPRYTTASVCANLICCLKTKTMTTFSYCYANESNTNETKNTTFDGGDILNFLIIVSVICGVYYYDQNEKRKKSTGHN